MSVYRADLHLATRENEHQDRRMTMEENPNRFPLQLMASDATRSPLPNPTVEAEDSMHYIPVDGLLKSIQSKSPFVMGIAWIPKPKPSGPPSVESQIQRDGITELLAQRCCEKTERRTMLIRIRTSDKRPDASVDSTPIQSGQFHTTEWFDYAPSTAAKNRWYAQLTEFTQWKHEYELLLIDLGDVYAPTVSRVGKLCHGIAVPILDSSNARHTIRALKALQEEPLNILGVWTVENAKSKELRAA